MSMINLLRRMFGGRTLPASRPSNSSAIETPSREAPPDFPAEVDPAPDLDSIFYIVEVDDAEPLVGTLFRRRFNTDSFPDNPHHFVALARLPDNSLLTLGYVHYTLWENCALCGGLVIDDRHYRRLPHQHRQILKRAGGIAELLLRQTLHRLPPNLVAIWGHVGNQQARKVDLRVGFEDTDDPYLMVIWRQDLSDTEKAEWIKKALAITPF